MHPPAFLCLLPAGLAAVLLAACRPEPRPPAPDEVCWLFSSGDDRELCDEQFCTPRTTTITRNATTGVGFELRSACPTPEDLASAGNAFENYKIEYRYQDAPSGATLTLDFVGTICAQELNVESMRAALQHGSAILRPQGDGLSGYTETGIQASDVQLLEIANGRLKARIEVPFNSVRYGSGDLTCRSDSGLTPGFRECSCHHSGSATASIVFDLHAPITAASQP